MSGPSRVGTITDPLKGRVVVDEFLNKVDASSGEAAFVYHPADLERAKARREALGLGTEDEAKRAQRESRVVEAAAATRRADAARADAALLEASAAADKGSAEDTSARSGRR